MVMKDKLVKTNHKGGYYVMKKLCIASIAIASAAFVIAVPTYIVQSSNAKKTIILAEEKSSEVVEENNSGESLEYEEYNNQEN